MLLRVVDCLREVGVQLREKRFILHLLRAFGHQVWRLVHLVFTRWNRRLEVAQTLQVGSVEALSHYFLRINEVLRILVSNFGRLRPVDAVGLDEALVRYAVSRFIGRA